MPSTLSRLAVKDLHFIWSLVLCTHSPYFSPVQSFMLSMHIILGLPHPLFTSIFPSSNNLYIPFCQIKCPKYWSFSFLLLSLSVVFWMLSFLALLQYIGAQSMISSSFFCISTFQMLLVCFELPLPMSMSLNYKVTLTICNTVMLFFLVCMLIVLEFSTFDIFFKCTSS